MGRLFAPFSAVAADESLFNRAGRIHAGGLVAVSERNRMIADPYTRLLVARDQVNQAAAVVIASTEAAQELGIDPRRWVYLHGYSKRQGARDHEPRGSRRMPGRRGSPVAKRWPRRA